MSTRTDRDGITNALRETADALGRLLAGHLKLARLELIGDASDVARRAAAAAAFTTLAAIGYVLVVLGLAALLAPALGWAGALLTLGAVHLLGGGLGALIAVRRLREVEVLDRTAQAAAHSVAKLRTSERGLLAREEERAV